MAQQEHKRRPPVFQAASEAEPVRPEPPLKTPVEEFDDLVGGDAEAPLPSLSQKVGDDKEIDIEPLPPSGGWQLLGMEQQTGKQYLVTHDTLADGVRAHWKKTRMMSHFRWVLHGKWLDSMTNRYLIPQPLYFKEIN